MRKKTLGCCSIFSCLFLQATGLQPAAQDPMKLRVNVVLVELNVAVTDSKGNYVTGLRPEDFVITEDKVPQKISTFEESRESAPGFQGGYSAGSGFCIGKRARGFGARSPVEH